MKKVLGIVGVGVLAIDILWGTEVYPQNIGTHVATEYVQENYEGMAWNLRTSSFQRRMGIISPVLLVKTARYIILDFSQGGFRSPWYMTA